MAEYETIPLKDYVVEQPGTGKMVLVHGARSIEHAREQVQGAVTGTLTVELRAYRGTIHREVRAR